MHVLSTGVSSSEYFSDISTILIDGAESYKVNYFLSTNNNLPPIICYENVMEITFLNK